MYIYIFNYVQETADFFKLIRIVLVTFDRAVFYVWLCLIAYEKYLLARSKQSQHDLKNGYLWYPNILYPTNW